MSFSHSMTNIGSNFISNKRLYTKIQWCSTERSMEKKRDIIQNKKEWEPIREKEEKHRDWQRNLEFMISIIQKFSLKRLLFIVVPKTNYTKPYSTFLSPFFNNHETNFINKKNRYRHSEKTVHKQTKKYR